MKTFDVGPVIQLLLGLFAVCPPLASADPSELPAVSAPNGVVGARVSAVGDGDDHAGGILAGGQWTTPIAERFGARVNLNAGLSIDSAGTPREAAGGMLGLFWRRPEQGFVELSAGGVHLGPADWYEGAFTAGLFRDAWDLTIGAAAFGSGGSLSGGGQLDVGHYLNDDLRFTLGVGIGSGESYQGEASATWQPDLPQNLGFRFTAGGGAIDGNAVYMGSLEVFYYFGESRTLRRKIREDW